MFGSVPLAYAITSKIADDPDEFKDAIAKGTAFTIVVGASTILGLIGGASQGIKEIYMINAEEKESATGSRQ